MPLIGATHRSLAQTLHCGLGGARSSVRGNTPFPCSNTSNADLHINSNVGQTEDMSEGRQSSSPTLGPWA